MYFVILDWQFCLESRCLNKLMRTRLKSKTTGVIGALGLVYARIFCGHSGLFCLGANQDHSLQPLSVIGMRHSSSDVLAWLPL